ncbi:MAG: hypothetical protein GDA50_07140 [Alphaproteobacteria bacterium GM202ARS2]|nr:hypothetical protein [Alphaproteobacteria bacterium GM202ARS2]
MRIFVICLVGLSVSSCAGFGVPPPQAPPLTPVDIEQIQSRSFASSAESVFKATLGALQGLGYIVGNANMEAGFLSATTPREVIDAPRGNGFIEALLAAALIGATLDEPHPYGGRHHVPADKVTRHVRLSANVRQRGTKSVLRVSLVEVLDRASGRGQTSGVDTPIYDRDVYEKIFQRIEDELFVFEGLPTQTQEGN